MLLVWLNGLDQRCCSAGADKSIRDPATRCDLSLTRACGLDVGRLDRVLLNDTTAALLRPDFRPSDAIQES